MNPEHRAARRSDEYSEAERFVSTYEQVISRGDEDVVARLQEIIYDGIFYVPGYAPGLYDLLARSQSAEVRQTAAIGIAKAFKCDPEAGASVWNKLLKDGDKEVARAAYESLDEFCLDMELGLEHLYNLDGVIG